MNRRFCSVFSFPFLQKDGEKKAAAVEGGEKKADGGGKKEEGPMTVVMKLDLHCEGCAKKVQKAIRHFEGTATTHYFIFNSILFLLQNFHENL